MSEPTLVTWMTDFLWYVSYVVRHYVCFWRCNLTRYLRRPHADGKIFIKLGSRLPPGRAWHLWNEVKQVHAYLSYWTRDSSCVSSNLRDRHAAGTRVFTVCSHTRINSCVDSLRLNIESGGDSASWLMCGNPHLLFLYKMSPIGRTSLRLYLSSLQTQLDFPCFTNQNLMAKSLLKVTNVKQQGSC